MVLCAEIGKLIEMTDLAYCSRHAKIALEMFASGERKYEMSMLWKADFEYGIGKQVTAS